MSHKKTKKFIDKNKSEHFIVVNRSLLDPKTYEEGASKHVLVSAHAPPSAPVYRRGGSVADGDRGDERDDGRSAVTEDVHRGRGRHFSSNKSEGGYSHTSHRSSRGRGKHAAHDDDARSVSKIRVATKSVAGKSIQEYTELDENGFILDGYNYGRHFSDIGGGVFVSATGEIGSAVDPTYEAAARVDLPEDVLPSKGEQLDRMLEAIVLSDKTMPSDIREALQELDEDALSTIEEDDAEEEEHGGALESKQSEASNVKVYSGKYEELDDNFVLQALGELPIPEWPEGRAEEPAGADDGNAAELSAEFDFDAHVAKLMARAEGKWTDTAEDFDDEELEDDDFDGEDEHQHSATAAPGDAGKRIQENLLTAMLEQYDDDEIGELDPDDPRVRTGLVEWKHQHARGEHGEGDEHDDDDDEEGEGDEEDDWEHDVDEHDDADDEDADIFDGAEDGSSAAEHPIAPQQALNQIIEQYLTQRQNELDEYQLLAGIPRSKPKKRFNPEAPAAATVDTAELEKPTTDEASAPSVSHNMTSVAANNGPSTAAFSVKVGGGSRIPDYIYDTDSESDGEQFNEKYLPDFWKGKKPEKKWDVETILSTHSNAHNMPQKLPTSVSVASSVTGFMSKKLDTAKPVSGSVGVPTSYGPTTILLSKKTGMPLNKGKMKAAMAAAAATVDSTGDNTHSIPEKPENEDDASALSASSSASEADSEKGAPHARSKTESAEEKRLRKQAVKNERREKRKSKKSLKEAFKAERAKQLALVAHTSGVAKGISIH